MKAALGVVGAGRPSTRTRRRRSAAQALAAGLALALGVAFATPASAQTPIPATQGSARAYGISVGGLVTVPPTPDTGVVTNPDQVREQTVLPIDADPLLINATLRARAECQVNPTVAATLANQTPNNCRGYAIAEGLDVLLSGLAGAQTSLVSARVIEAEAVSRCVGGQGQLATGFRLLGLQVGGQDLTEDVTSTLQPVLQLTEEGGALAGIVQIAQNEVTRSGDRIAVNGLHIRILPDGGATGGLLDPVTGLLPGVPAVALPGGVEAPTAALDIIISHAEASMPTPCGVAAQRNPGPGPDLGAGPGAPLPRTGSNEMVAIPLAFGLLATAMVLRGVNRRARRATA